MASIELARCLQFCIFTLTANMALADTGVGTPAGTLSVNEMGAAVYSIPFDLCPSGTGFDPQIGLAYNSQQNSYGNAGFGTSITGISCITRASRDRFHDGTVQEVKYERGDAYVLDGMRLYPKTGTEGADGSTYTIEGNPYTTVTLHGNDTKGSTTVWFEMKDADGTTYQYQRRLRCYFGHPTKEYRVVAWYVSKATNINGDVINYTYSQYSNQMYPQTITYGRSGVTNSVTFGYASMSNPVAYTMEGGSTSNASRRLSYVTSSCQGNTYRRYMLTYDTSSDASAKKYDRLVSMNVQNGSGESLEPITFNWDFLQGANVSTTSMGIVTSTSHRFQTDNEVGALFSIDLNGDGIGEVIRMCTGRTLDGAGTLHTFVYVSRSHLDETGNLTYPDTLCYVLPPSFSVMDLSYNLESSGTADIDGDGLNDLLLPYYYAGTGNSYLQFFLIKGQFVKDGIRNYQTPLLITLNTRGANAPSALLDFDGDGKDDFLYIEDKKKDGFYHGKILANELQTDSCCELRLTYSQDKDLKKMFLVDCNADGLQDIVMLFEDGYKIYYNNGGGCISSLFSESRSTEVTSSSTLKDYWRMEQGDFDGDGLIDFVCFPESESVMKTLRNEGNGTFTLAGSTNVDYVNLNTVKDDGSFAVRVADFDKDGRSDVLVSKQDMVHHTPAIGSNYWRYRKTQIRWYLSNGTAPVLWRTIDKTRDEDDSNEVYIFTGDFNGDGYAEIANYGSNLSSSTDNTFTDNTINIYSFPTDVFVGRITDITNGFGSQTGIEYLSGTSPRVYSSGSASSTYPVNTYSVPLPLVSHVSQSNGAAGTVLQSYNYSGLMIHLGGRGLIGFTTTMTRTTRGLLTDTCRTVVEWDQNRWIPLKTTTTTYLGGKSATSKTQNTIVSENSWNGNYFSFPATTEDTDFDGFKTNASRTYDTATGVPTNETTSYDRNAGMYTSTSYSNYATYSGRRLPQRVTVSKKHADDANVHQVRTDYTYNNKGYVLSEAQASSYNGSSILLTRHFQRDGYGNVLSEWTTGNDVITVTKQYTYDSHNLRLTTSSTTPASSHVSYTYDIWGNVTSKQEYSDPSNILTTTYGYDGWGNQILSIAPDSTETQTQTSWNRNYANSVYSTTVTTDGSAPVTTVYDSEGRKLASMTKGKGGVDISTSYLYDANGKPSIVSTTEGERTQTETTEYDNFGRTTSHTSSDGTVSSYEYHGREVTENTPTGSSVKEYDAWGNIRIAHDAGGTVEYTYNSMGNPREIEANGSICTIEYDGAGHRTSLDDPDAGTQTYSYAADGRVLSQTDGNGVTTTFVYDNLGRVTERRCGDDIVQITTYGTSGYGKNRIVQEECNGNVETYEYDRLGRVVNDTRVYNEETYSKSFTYDSYGRVSTLSYPGDVTVRYTYDQYGFMNAIYANEVCCYSQSSYNGLTDVSSAGTLTYTESIASNGRTSSQVIKRFNTILDNMSYTYDNGTGNLASRSRGIYTESFSYDDADRLLTVTSNRSETYAEGWYDGVMIYDDNGNVTYKTGIGDYGYTSAKPHALTVIDNVEDGVSGLGQLVTAFNEDGKIDHILSSANTVNRYNLNFYYGPNRQKWGTLKVSPVTGPFVIQIPSIAHFFFDDYERISEENSVTEQYFPGKGVILVKQNGVLRVCKAFSDIQGSVLSIYDVTNGSEVFRASYDAWGRQQVETNNIEFSHGYCGHDMLPEFGLIDMGGRVYDPETGRFLSCDNFVQAPDNTQSFNRYTYCLNNPFRYTDPTGDFWNIILGAAIGGTINWITHGCKFNKKGLGYFAVGAVAGATGAGVAAGVTSALSSMGFLSGFAVGASSGFSEGFITGAGNSWIGGSSFKKGLKAGTLGGLTGAISSGVTTGVASGLKAYHSKSNFWLGKDRASLSNKLGGHLSNSIDEIPDHNVKSLKAVYEDVSNPNLHIEYGQLPDPDTWNSMSSFQKGELGKNEAFLKMKDIFGDQNYVSEVSYKVNGEIYRADWSFVDENGLLYMAESKAGNGARFTTNQRITIPALLKGDNLNIVPFGARAKYLFPNGIPSRIEKFTFKMYWFRQ